MTTGAMNADLQRERAQATIAVEEFAEWWAGGAEALRKRRALERLFFDDPAFDDPVHISYMSHKELYEHSVAKSTKFIKKLREWQTKATSAASGSESTGSKSSESVTTPSATAIQSTYEFRTLLAGALGTGLFQQSFPLRVHFSVFLPALVGLATEQQQREWLPKAWNMEIVGTYAQTELGHGTFVRGLETRADYDAEREQFVLNTPTLSAYKWWPGGLGQAADVALVMAQLYVRGQHCGLHPFLVRIRDAETHLPLPGVDVGEVGPKMGLNAVNNGFLGLRDVRIPRSQMLMKNARLLADGTFVKGPEPLLTYGAMVYGRVAIVRDVSFGLLQAATIATRYSAVRRQSPIEPGQPEPQILDHVTQQLKVLPQIAKGVFFRLAADFVWSLYTSVAKELDAGERRNLPELHALSCCLKAVCSGDASAGVEVLRKACGGQGFVASANFADIYSLASAACTYEGENTVLLLQTARFLTKQYLEGVKRRWLPPSVEYLRSRGRLQWSSQRMLESAVLGLEIAAAERTRLAIERKQKRRKDRAAGRSEAEAANLTGPSLVRAATLHGKAFMTRLAVREVARIAGQVSPPLAQVLGQLLEIFVLDTFLENLADVVRFSPLRQQQIDEVELRFESVLANFRRNAVAVVDGFDFHDRVLGSTLGCYDGRVYERLMAEAKKSPLNQESVNRSFHEHLKPLMKGKL